MELQANILANYVEIGMRVKVSSSSSSNSRSSRVSYCNTREIVSPGFTFNLFHHVYLFVWAMITPHPPTPYLPFPFMVSWQVLDGIYAGDTGMVLALEERESGPVAVVAVDGGRREIEVRQSQAKQSSESAMSRESVNGCELYDMVMFGYNQYGVIIRIGRDTVEVREE